MLSSCVGLISPRADRTADLAFTWSWVSRLRKPATGLGPQSAPCSCAAQALFRRVSRALLVSLLCSAVSAAEKPSIAEVHTTPCPHWRSGHRPRYWFVQNYATFSRPRGRNRQPLSPTCIAIGADPHLQGRHANPDQRSALFPRARSPPDSGPNSTRRLQCNVLIGCQLGCGSTVFSRAD